MSTPAASIASSDPSPSPPAIEQTALKVLAAISVAHMLNDIIQSLIPATYPLLRDSLQLSYGDIGLITFAFQLTASLLQPFVGMYTDRKPKPYSLAIGMGLTLFGLLFFSQARSLITLMASASLIGMGSSIFHPEASRMAHMAAGGRHGFAQSLFQVGGNFGTSLGPLLAAAIIFPFGQTSIAWFALIALVGIIVLTKVGAWYHARLASRAAKGVSSKPQRHSYLTRRQVTGAMGVLVALVLSKYIYLVSFTSYYALYMEDKFGVTKQQSQLCSFAFLFAVAVGTFAGGPLGDRFGRKVVIWFSILGVAPFALALPHAGLIGTIVLTVFIGVILASAFSAILVFAQELLPGRVGAVAGLFFGFAFGISAIAAALLGAWADHTSLENVFQMCAYLPLMGIITAFLPKLESPAP
ncbi:MFS transporter [Allorhodopirellula heiligendammensis]|uniref:Fosmidomycin resistance protein n=1 Tax=Allorhodopirellula heiligendammensis TaxID=2714739 RepID=A0A5C6BZ41_9BACT|nr:MFS transporter [Allorhodopirellula heiligendammensis]TWU16957.1 Fosmidomycin resistance protein [Allorhodopirellula heiligendammensis]